MAALSLAACSSNKSSGQTTTTNGSGGQTTTTSSASNSTSTTAASAGGSLSAKISSLMANVQSAKGGSFDLTYAEASSSGSGTNITFAEDGSKYYFQVAQAAVIDTGTATYACSDTGAGTTFCEDLGSAAQYTEALVEVLTGQTVSTQLSSLRSDIAEKIAGDNATFSTGSYAGQSANCVSGSDGGNTFKYCIASSGVLAYAGGSTVKTYGSLTLSSYGTNPPASDFALPKGAQIESVGSTG